MRKARNFRAFRASGEGPAQWPAGFEFGMIFGAPGVKGVKLFDDYVARVTARPAFQRVTPSQ